MRQLAAARRHIKQQVIVHVGDGRYFGIDMNVLAHEPSRHTFAIQRLMMLKCDMCNEQAELTLILQKLKTTPRMV
ncbi:hypothetical protein D3C72_2200010 [compost metagenome]